MIIQLDTIAIVDLNDFEYLHRNICIQRTDGALTVTILDRMPAPCGSPRIFPNDRVLPQVVSAFSITVSHAALGQMLKESCGAPAEQCGKLVRRMPTEIWDEIEGWSGKQATGQI